MTADNFRARTGRTQGIRFRISPPRSASARIRRERPCIMLLVPAVETVTGISAICGGALTVSTTGSASKSSRSAGTACMKRPPSTGSGALKATFSCPSTKISAIGGASCPKDTKSPLSRDSTRSGRSEGPLALMPPSSARRGTIAANRASGRAWGVATGSPSGRVMSRRPVNGTQMSAQARASSSATILTGAPTSCPVTSNGRITAFSYPKLSKPKALKRFGSGHLMVPVKSGTELVDRSMTGARPASPGVRQ